MRRALLVVGVLLLLIGLGWTATEVGALAAEERDYRGDRLPLAEQGAATVTLGRVTLARDQTVAFSVCSTDAFDGVAWNDAWFGLYHHPPTERVLRVALDEPRRARMRRGPGGGCVDVARSEHLSGEGEFSVTLETAPGGRVSSLGAADARVWTHVTAQRPLGARHMYGPLLGFLAVLVLTFAWLFPAPAPNAFEALAQDALERPAAPVGPDETPPGEGPPEPPSGVSPALDGPAPRPGRELALGLAGLVLVFLASALAPSALPSPLVPPLVLFVGQLCLAFVLIRPSARLGLLAPVRWPALMVVLPALGGALRRVLSLTTRGIPTTGVAPIEQMVSAPSGMLSMLAIGLVAPLAEEIFFRGLVYGRVSELRGRAWAVGVTAGLFALLHAPQAFGAWPSFVSIACAGLVFTLVRAATGSTLASVLTHLGYNGVIALPVVQVLLSHAG